MKEKKFSALLLVVIDFVMIAIVFSVFYALFRFAGFDLSHALLLPPVPSLLIAWFLRKKLVDFYWERKKTEK